jgi:hypothetical protein
VLLLSLATAGPAARAAGDLTVTPYLWYAGLEGTLGSGGTQPDGGAESNFDHFWDNMSLGGAMLNISWRQARWTAFGDWTYAKVKTDSPTGLPKLYSEANAEVRGTVMQAYAGYDVLPTADGHLDVFAGTRYYDIDVKVGLEGAALADREADGDAQWFDAVVGARYLRRFADRWEAYVQGDVGAGGSSPSWQLIASVGYRYDWGTLVGGWRYLESDYEDDSLVFNAWLTGPFLGASFRF